MLLRFFVFALCIFFLGVNVRGSFAQEEEEGNFIIEQSSQEESGLIIDERSGDEGLIIEEVPTEEGVIIEEELGDADFKTDLEEEEPKQQYITVDVLTIKDVSPAVNYYIHSDINRKFSGLVTNLKLEKVYGIHQEDRVASVYFDYSYTSVRNRDNILFEKGKITFIKFNSGRWFNAELSIYLMDRYPFLIKRENILREE